MTAGDPVAAWRQFGVQGSPSAASTVRAKLLFYGVLEIWPDWRYFGRMRKWPLQEARDHLSEVVDLAIEEGPQTVTRHGKEVAVVVAKADFERRPAARGQRGTLLPFLRRLGFRRAGLSFERSKDRDRDSGF
jgi:prevent-host-death family protein